MNTEEPLPDRWFARVRELQQTERLSFQEAVRRTNEELLTEPAHSRNFVVRIRRQSQESHVPETRRRDLQ